MAEASRRRTVVRRASEVPIPLVDEMIDDMGRRMSGTVEARRCGGLSFGFVIADRRVAPARYEVGRDGRVRLSRGDAHPSTFVFTGDADVFDAVMRGNESAFLCLLRRRVHLHGSLTHIRSLLRMMPAVERAYGDARAALFDRHGSRYDFRF